MGVDVERSRSPVQDGDVSGVDDPARLNRVEVGDRVTGEHSSLKQRVRDVAEVRSSRIGASQIPRDHNSTTVRLVDAHGKTSFYASGDD